MKPSLAAAVAAVALVAAGAASADVLHYRADLKSADSPHAKGLMKADLDTDRRALDVTVTYLGVSGPATDAGFEPSGTTKAELAVPIAGVSPAHATVTLTNAQIDDLNAGRLSFYVDTKAGGSGELRGKVSRSTD